MLLGRLAGFVYVAGLSSHDRRLCSGCCRSTLPRRRAGLGQERSSADDWYAEVNPAPHTESVAMSRRGCYLHCARSERLAKSRRSTPLFTSI